MSRRLYRSLIVGIVLAVCVSVAWELSVFRVIPSFGAMKNAVLGPPRYDLTESQLGHLDATARLGYYGQDGFQMLLDNFDGPSLKRTATVRLGEKFSVDSSATLQAALADHPEAALYGGNTDLKDADGYTPSADENGSYVTYDGTFVNLYDRVSKSLVLRNPDPKFFGDDGVVSIPEMSAFFASALTQLASVHYVEHDDASYEPDCAFDLNVDGSTLATDAVEGCKHHVRHSTTPELLTDLEGMWSSSYMTEQPA
jgi:hypothetical protein